MENVPKATIMNEEKMRKPIGYILKSERYVKSHKIKYFQNTQRHKQNMGNI